MAKKRKLGGVGAVGRARIKQLHPSEPLRTKYGSDYDREYLDDLEIIRSDKGRVTRRGKIVDRFHVRTPQILGTEFVVDAAYVPVQEDSINVMLGLLLEDRVITVNPKETHYPLL